MKLHHFIVIAAFCALFSLTACIDNNNKDNDGQVSGNPQESDYGQEAPTYNKSREDIEDSTATGASSDKRIPKDPVERQSKGNAASK
jgi:hypothetical protein